MVKNRTQVFLDGSLALDFADFHPSGHLKPARIFDEHARRPLNRQRCWLWGFS
jgi:hypothetical protein